MAPAASLPIVRLTLQMLGDPEGASWVATRARVMLALEDYGCFEVTFDGITSELRESAMNAVKDAVSLSVETKRKNVPTTCTRGYVGKEHSSFAYESLAVDNVLHPEAASDFSSLMWPEGNDTFCDNITRFSKAVVAVEKAVRKMVLEGLGVEKYFDSHVGFIKYLLRLSEYSPQGQNGDKQLTLLPHTDVTFTGLVLQSHVNGFEVKTKKGEWITVVPSSSCSLIFIIGDLFRAWSNGRLYAPAHRVRVREGEIRRVALVFAVPNGDRVIEAPPEFVNEENPLQFRPFRYFEYRKFFSANVQAAVDDPTSVLSAFCGTGAFLEAGRASRE